MPREASPIKVARLEKVLSILSQTYPNAYCELNYRTPLELLVATILSAQCTDKQVNIVTAALFARYRSASEYAHASLETLENDIRRIGLYRNKAKNIQQACRKLVELHGGEVPRTMEALTALAGVGRKTANVVLGNVFGINLGVVVDTHVQRLSQRLGFTREKTPEKIEQNLMKQVPSDQWTVFSHRLIWHGRRRCMARNPACAECELSELCPSKKTYLE
jgi:endonuclease-3